MREGEQPVQPAERLRHGSVMLRRFGAQPAERFLPLEIPRPSFRE